MLGVSATGKGATLDERLKELMRELGNAISEALAGSKRIADVLEELERAGYDVFLVLEAAVGWNRHAGNDELVEVEEEIEPEIFVEPHTPGKIRWTPQDQIFLKALKIAVDDE